MGNLLCRNKTPRRVYVKGPIQGTDVFDPQLFSNDSLVNGTRKEVPSAYNNNSNNTKMFFSTPNLKSDLKSTVSLDARIFDRGNSKNPPIAPPRKKRTTLKKGSTLPSALPSDAVRNGFKEVFGNSSISSSNIDDLDYIDKEENSLQERSTDERTSTPEKKLKIGNKKSDKFFGESLSDHLSDEPVSPILISKEEQSLEDSKNLADKNLSSFLMNMLDDMRNGEDEQKYKGQIPVEEPPFIARRRETKHICDDDDHMHSHIHKNENDYAPPKPDRDFSKFQSPIPNIDVEIIEAPNIEKVENIQAKVRVKRGISRENLPSPPATPHRKKCTANSPTTPTITVDTSDGKALTNEIQNSNEKPKELTKDNELQNDEHITPELVDLVIKKAYGMSDFNYHPEDFSHHTHDDGSNLVTPTSKLSVRKISTPRKISTESAPSLDNVNEAIDLQINNMPMSSTAHRGISSIENDQEVRNKKTPIENEDPNSEEKKLLIGSNMNDIIDEIYNKNSEIMKEFQSFLEQSIEKEPIINVDDEKKFLDSTRSLDDDAKDPTKDCHEDEFDNRTYSDSFESTDEDEEIKKVITNIKSESESNKRRESIEDVDNWFSHHIEMDQKESEVCNSHFGEQRLSIGYDTNKIFPFGSTITGRRDSQSDEFFTDTSNINQRVKSHIEPVQEAESSILEEEDETKAIDRKATWSKESSPDHSTLLKFLDKNNAADTNAKN